MLADVAKKVALLQGGFLLAEGDIYRMLDRMIEQQEKFISTRAAHAAGLFSQAWDLVVVREDVPGTMPLIRLSAPYTGA